MPGVRQASSLDPTAMVFPSSLMAMAKPKAVAGFALRAFDIRLLAPRAALAREDVERARILRLGVVEAD